MLYNTAMFIIFTLLGTVFFILVAYLRGIYRLRLFKYHNFKKCNREINVILIRTGGGGGGGAVRLTTMNRNLMTPSV